MNKERLAPGIFSKPIKKKKWDKKYIKKIYLPEDKKFLESLLIEEGDTVRVNAAGLSKKDLKRLKELGKAIKQNRKSLNFILIFVLILIVGGLVFFEVYLKNKLVQRLIETQLEKVFLAQVDTDGVELSIFDGKFSMEYLAIADSGNPMTNLFECSSVKADFETAELLQGRVFIEELGFSGLKRGTARSESGSLSAVTPGKESAAVSSTVVSKSDKSKDVIGDVVTQIGALAGEINVEQLLEQQKSNLKSFQVIEESKTRVESYAGDWEGRAAEWQQKVGGWETSVNYIQTVNPDSFTNIESARTTITKLQGIYNDAERDYTAIKKDYAEAESQINEASTMVDTIQDAIELDYEYVESLVSMPAGDKIDWAASILEEQLSMPIKKYLSYLNRGLEWYKRFERLAEKREEQKPEARRPGRSLPAPADAPPGFVLVHAFASGEEPGLRYSFDLNNLISEPEKWVDKTSLAAALDMPATGAANAVITEDGLSLDVPAAPFDLGNVLQGLDISSFTGQLALVSDVAWDDTGFNGNVNIETSNLSLSPAAADSILFRLINTTVEASSPVGADGRFTWSESDGLDLSLETGLDEGLGNAASALLSEGAEEGLKMLKDYLGIELAGPLEDFDSVKAEFENYVDKIENYENELDKYKNMADDKIAEIEKSVKDKTKAQAEQLIKDAVPDEVNKTVDDAAGSLKDALGGKLKF